MADNGEKKVTLAGIVVGQYGVEVHPEFWEDLKKAPQDIQEAAKDLIEKMRLAAQLAFEKKGHAAREEDFLAEMVKLTGQEPEPLEEDDYRRMEEIEQRHGNFPTKH